MKNLTQVQAIKQENIEVKAAVLKLLNCHSNHYNSLQFEMGLTYLDNETKLDKEAAKIMAETPLFWAWWRNQWVKRDKDFLRTVRKIGAARKRTIYRAETIAQTYQKYHSVNSILFSPHKAAIRESYAQFIGKLNKEIVNG